MQFAPEYYARIQNAIRDANFYLIFKSPSSFIPTLTTMPITNSHFFFRLFGGSNLQRPSNTVRWWKFTRTHRTTMRHVWRTCRYYRYVFIYGKPRVINSCQKNDKNRARTKSDGGVFVADCPLLPMSGSRISDAKRICFRVILDYRFHSEYIIRFV